jgi:hypothetical protein
VTNCGRESVELNDSCDGAVFIHGPFIRGSSDIERVSVELRNEGISSMSVCCTQSVTQSLTQSIQTDRRGILMDACPLHERNIAGSNEVNY